jgi:hypothetical protein
MTRHLERIERHVDISNEALAVFVRFWLTSTPALPDTGLAAAQTKGRERYEGIRRCVRAAAGQRHDTIGVAPLIQVLNSML